jgi:RNA binding exosome subunit
MIAHFIELSVFSTPEDDPEQIYAGLASLVPFELEAEKLKIERISATGFTERKIIIFHLRLTKQRHIAGFLENIRNLLNEEQKELLIGQADTRLDEEMHYFLRLDKSRLIKDGEHWLTDEGSCYHIKISLAPFPRKRQNALEIVRGLFS